MASRKGKRVQQDEPADEIDQSFRDSFYESGTDWSSLYEVDEFGMPLGDVKSEDLRWSAGSAQESHPSFEGTSHVAPTSSSGCPQLLNGVVRHECTAIQAESYVGGSNGGTMGTRTGFSFQRQGIREQRKAGVTKMVQTDLSAFLGVKLRSTLEHTVTEKRQKDIGPYFGVPALPQEIPAKTRRVGGVFSSSDKAGTTKKSDETASKMNGVNDRQRVIRSCPFYKKIPGTAFTVDAFRYGAVEGCSAYFLTHFHADHYGGLTRWWSHGPIYCTPITGRLLALCLSVSAEWIHPIQVGTTEVVDGVQVRMLEANHCPGAALIFFRLPTGERILHTGDFRACKDMQTYPELLNARINTLYLDTTYCNPRYTFPLQEDAINFAVKVAKDTLMQNSRTLIVVGAYSIGKERVYLGLAEELGVNIFADKHRMRVLSSLNWAKLSARLTDDANMASLHVLPISHLNTTRLKDYLQSLPRYTTILGFRPTGWTYSQKVGSRLHLIKPQCNGPITIYGVPYSEHSSYIELEEFVRFLRPEKVIPTVNIGRAAERERMQSLFRQWQLG